MTDSVTERAHFPLVDLGKAVAAQLIVLHHLAWFGPMSDVAVQLSPWIDALRSGLANYGRYAVFVFIAVGGYLAVQSLSSSGVSSPLRLIGRRYLRLILPFAVAMLLAVAGAAIARQLMTHESIGNPVELGQFVAHLLLLHSLLGVESLSAGVWYVAIDFQLYTLLVILLVMCRRTRYGAFHPASADFSCFALVAGLALVSLLYFSRDARWDATALYFFGAYTFGILAGWAGRAAQPAPLWLVMALLGGVALAVEFRGRIAVALLTVLVLVWAQRHSWRAQSRLAALGRTSYALFLVHFPVCLVVNALFTHFAPDSPALNLAGVLLAWGASNGAAFVFHYQVEVRLARLAPLSGH